MTRANPTKTLANSLMLSRDFCNPLQTVVELIALQAYFTRLEHFYACGRLSKSLPVNTNCYLYTTFPKAFSHSSTLTLRVPALSRTPGIRITKIPASFVYM